MNSMQRLRTALAEPTDSVVRSYLTLRKAIGWLGILLPFGVSLGAWFIFGDTRQSSISAYYYTGTRNLLVGMLCAIGVFMLTYKGPQRVDEAVSFLAGLFAVGIAFFPTAPVYSPSTFQTTIGRLHYTFAALFFSLITYMTLFLFTRGDPAGFTRKKRQRNAVYRVCGWIMFGCVVLLVVQALLPDEMQGDLKAHQSTFWLEATAIISFGIAWLTKGEFVLADEPGEGPDLRA